MGGAPWFRFYPTDYLADAKVKRLSRAHRSMLLDCWCWIAQDGSIPSDPKELSLLLGDDPRACRSFLQIVLSLPLDESQIDLSFFVEHNGRLYSTRLSEETEKYKAKLDRLRASASLGGLHTQANAKAIAKANAKATLQAKSTEPEPEPEPEKDKEQPLPLQASPSVVVRVPRAKRIKKETKTPSWQQAIPEEILSTVAELKSAWPDRGKGATQPDSQGQPVPIISWPETAKRLIEITEEGGLIGVLRQIGLRAVGEWRAGKWIKAPQHFYGSSVDAPWKAYYSAELTNRKINEVRNEQKSA